MSYYLVVVLLTTVLLQAGEHVVMERKYTIEYDDDEVQPNIYLVQSCNMENEQKNTYSNPINDTQHPTPEKNAQLEQFSWSNWMNIRDFISPLKIGFVGCLIGIIYFLKTKFSLYSLSKSCVQSAFWSLWKAENRGYTQNDCPDAHLLYDILSTYQTDRYALAISLFLQDVDAETEILHRYLEQAQKTQTSILHFALPNMDHDILEAQTRLANLAWLKQIVLSWLAHSNTLGNINENA